MLQNISLICHRRVTWLWVGVILLIVPGSAGCQNNTTSQSANSLFYPIPVRPTASPSRTFNVSEKPTLMVENAIGGKITVHGGDTHQVVVTATRHKSSSNSTDNIYIDMKQKNDEIDVKAYTKNTSNDNQSVDLAITLPATSDIHARVMAGRIDVDGISGQMDLTSDAGPLSYKNGTIRGSSTFKTQAGFIDFTGALADNGTYDFQNGAGGIALTLPDDSSFKLDVSTEAGIISNKFGSNTVGTHPTSRLRVHTDAGMVDIRKKGSADIDSRGA